MKVSKKRFDLAMDTLIYPTSIVLLLLILFESSWFILAILPVGIALDKFASWMKCIFVDPPER